MNNHSTPTFTVIDCETTGLHPGGHDRIIEIAVLQLNSAGEINNQIVTLINPKRDIGAINKHGIRSGDLLPEPRTLN